jgi:small basic protein (TIGR04137 family)
MSLDKSLKTKDRLRRHRNVLTRAERIDSLKEADLWTEDSTAIGLPKVNHRKAAVGKKDKAKKDTTADGAEGTESTEAGSDEKPKA